MKKGRLSIKFLIIFSLVLTFVFSGTQVYACSLTNNTDSASSEQNYSWSSENVASVYVKSISVLNFGAKGDGVALDTYAIQSAIDFAHDYGGCEVYFPAGIYKTTMLRLKSNVALNITSGATLMASTNQADWAYCDLNPVIFAYGQTNMAVYGSGTIDGGGLYYYDSAGDFIDGYRPQSIISLQKSNAINISDITLQNSTYHTEVFMSCEYVLCSGQTIRNRSYDKNRETDGISFSDSKHVIVKNCDVMTGDDAISLGTDQFGECYDVLVEDCTIATTCNATKIGTWTISDIYDITFNNITINRFPGALNSCAAAITLQSNDGGKTHDITCSNYTINDCETPIFLALQNRQTIFAHSVSGQLYNINLINISCSNSTRASQINTEEGLAIGRVTFDNVQIQTQERFWIPENAALYGSTPTNGKPVLVINGSYDTAYSVNRPKLLNGSYPDAWNYGRMPAYGLFARNVTELIIKDNVSFYDNSWSGRPKYVYENVTLAH